MDLTIHYDHTKRGNAQMLGTTEERWNEIQELRIKTISMEEIEFNSQAIEWVISQLRDVQPCDLVIVGYMFG